MDEKKDREGLDLEIVELAYSLLEEGVTPTPEVLGEHFPDREDEIRAALRAVESYRGRIRQEQLSHEDAFGFAGLAPGTVLGDFSIVSVLGRGSMGVVYRARQKSLGDREVALKVLPPALVARDPRFLDRFRREAALASEVHQENMAEIYGFGESDGQVYFAMRLVEGRTLADLLGSMVQRRNSGAGQLPRGEQVRRLVRIAAEVAAALAALHEKGLVHRDVKPSNVILENAGPDDFEALGKKPVLIDFGLIRPIEGSDTTGSRSVMGTKPYASHEAQLGQEVDARTDVFSLGATLYDLLTLTRPRERGPATAALPSPRACNPAVDDRLAAVVRMAMDDQHLRYADGAELRRELLRYLNDEPLRALPSSWFGRFRLWARREPMRAVRISAAAAIPLFLLVFSMAWAAGQIIPVYAAASRGADADRRGDLPTAAASYRQVHDAGDWVRHLPALGDDREIAEQYWGEGALAGAILAFDPERSESEWRTAQVEFQRRLLAREELGPSLRVLRYLIRVLREDDSATRQALAAESLAHRLLIFPVSPDRGAPLPQWSAELQGLLLEIAAPGDLDAPPTELRYWAISALSGLGQPELFSALAPLTRHRDGELRRLAVVATHRLWLRLRSSPEARNISDEELAAWCTEIWEGVRESVALTREVRRTQPQQAAARSALDGLLLNHVDEALEDLVVMLTDREQDLDCSPWREVPADLHRFLSLLYEATLAHLEGEPFEDRRQAAGEIWDSATHPLFDPGRWLRLLFDPGGKIAASREGGTYEDYENLLAASTEESPTFERINPEDPVGEQARFDFTTEAILLSGCARSLSSRGARHELEDPDSRDTPDARWCIALRRPRVDRVELSCPIPTGAAQATIRVLGRTSARWPLPRGGGLRLRVSTCNGQAVKESEQGVFRIKELVPDQTLAPLTTTFVVDVPGLVWNEELTLDLSLSSGTNIFWLNGVKVDFEVTDPGDNAR